MDAIILAGGFAKRMWPLTKNKPKQLLDVAGRPMLDYVIDSLINLDLDRIIVSVNSFFAPQFQDYLDSNTIAKNIELFIEDSNSEDQKLGALGALNLLFKTKNLKGPVFIAGGDNLSDFDLTKITKKNINKYFILKVYKRDKRYLVIKNTKFNFLKNLNIFPMEEVTKTKKFNENLNFKISNMNMSIKIKYLKNYKDFPFSNWIDQKKLDNYILPTFTKKIVRYLQNN